MQPNVDSDQGIDHLHTAYIRLRLWNLQTAILWANNKGYAQGTGLHWIYDGATTFLSEARPVAKHWACWSKTTWQGVPRAQPHIRSVKEDPPGTPWHKLRHSVPWKSSFFSGSKRWATWSQCLDSTSSDLDMKLSQLRVYMHRKPKVKERHSWGWDWAADSLRPTAASWHHNNKRW